MHRRTFLSGLGAAFLSPRLQSTQTPTASKPVASPSAPAAPADAWPHFRGTPALTGVSASTVPSELKRLWMWESGADVAVESSPAIVGGVVYVGTAAGELVALELATGALTWRYKAG